MYVASNGIKTAVILHDPDPYNPRDSDYQENLGTMICWHRRYNLGDKHNFSDAQELATALCHSVPDQALFAHIQKGNCSGLRAVESKEQPGVYTLQGSWDTHPSNKAWHDLDWSFQNGKFQPTAGDIYSDRSDLLEHMTTAELFRLVTDSNTAALKPLYLYDHSGLAMSTSSFSGRLPHAEWDSGCVGFIFMEKEVAMQNLAIEKNTGSVSMLSPTNYRKPVSVSIAPGENVKDAFLRNGFTPIRPEDIRPNTVNNPSDPTIPSESFLKNNTFYRKGNVLYTSSDHAPDGRFRLDPAAVFHPDFERVTEDTWKERAEAVLDGEVREYDAYLRGDVYGFKAYEGLEEIDSCWGFNAGSEDIRTLLTDMVGDWGNELSEKMSNASYDPSESFDIDEFHASHDFPGFRGFIRKAVHSYLQALDADPYPYSIPLNDILSDKNGILRNIIESLYDEHLSPTVQSIHETLQAHAGISRALQPKITSADLDPAKDYTAEELMAILNTKPALSDLISNAQSRQGSTTTPNHSPFHAHDNI